MLYISITKGDSISRENIINSIIMVAFFIVVTVPVLVLNAHDKVRKESLLIERESLSKDQKIIFDAKLERCTKRSGSTPSCWSDADWELFFLKYCERIKCD